MSGKGATVTPIDRETYRYRMKDLCEATGLDRQTIHFYIQQGLLPPGAKTGRNMAWYAEAHLERLRVIQRLQSERFLPLKAIKALLDGREAEFAPAQERFLERVRAGLAPVFTEQPSRETRVPARELLERIQLPRQDLDEAAELGMVRVAEEDGETQVSEADAWMLELFAQMRSAGFSRELGFRIADISIYDEAMSQLFQQELRLIFERLAHLPPETVATMIERALPVIHTFLSRHHAQRVKDFFNHLEVQDEE